LGEPERQGYEAWLPILIAKPSTSFGQADLRLLFTFFVAGFLLHPGVEHLMTYFARLLFRPGVDIVGPHFRIEPLNAMPPFCQVRFGKDLGIT